MEYVKVGRIYTTHGLNGEVKSKIIFEFRDKVLMKNMTFYFGFSKEAHSLISFRRQNEYDLLLFSLIDDIDIAIKYRGCDLYVDRNSLGNDIIKSDLLGYECFYNNTSIGFVSDITNEGLTNEVIRVKNLNKEILIPFDNNFISNIDKKSGIIYFNNLEGLL